MLDLSECAIGVEGTKYLSDALKINTVRLIERIIS